MVQYSSPELSRVFSALGDPTRLAMYLRIARGEAPAKELGEPFGISLTATLKHLRVLEDAGLAKTVKVGRVRRCRVQAQPLNQIEQWISDTRRMWTMRLDSLEDFLSHPEEE